MESEDSHLRSKNEDPLAPQVTLYSINSYSFGTKAPLLSKDSSAMARINRMKDKYAEEGIRRTVDAVMLVMEHNHPHILLIQVNDLYFKLPGGKIRPNESAEEGLLRKLNANLAPEVVRLPITFDTKYFELLIHPLGTYQTSLENFELNIYLVAT